MAPRYFWLAAVALVCIMAAAQFASERLEVQTADEAEHLVAGYSILRAGRFSLNAENPPVAKSLSALPLLWLNPDLPPEPADNWRDENAVSISQPFLYCNRVDADRLLFWGRLPIILMTLLFGIALAAWTRSRFGDIAALVALGLYCFDPNIIAHSRYVTSDSIAAYLYFLAAIAWGEYLMRRRYAWLAAAALFSGLGIGTKFNLLLLPALLLGLSLWYARKQGLRTVVKEFAVYCSIIAVTVWAVYGFEMRTIASDEPVARFLRLSSSQIRTNALLPPAAIALLDPATTTGAGVHWIAQRVPIPAYSLLKGLYRLANHSYWGHPAYLLGRVSSQGWWYYFPVGFLVKTPTGLILLVVLASLGFRRFAPSEGYPLGLLLIPPAVYFAVAMTSSIDIGIRHILPVYLFLFVWAGVAFSRFRGLWRVLAGIGILLVAVESMAVYPHYLAFFNTISGGSRNGPRYLVDSNIDWGQDVLKLKTYMGANGLPSIALEYFGSADLGYYQVAYEPLEVAIRAGRRCRAAISATALEMNPRFAALRKCQPIERVGYSIYIYELNSPECRVEP
jgi:hypothetical protein